MITGAIDVMDTLRGYFGTDDFGEADRDGDFGDEDTGLETPLSPGGYDERRLQVRAYRHWASLLGDRSYPSVKDLEPEKLPEFGPYSVLLDFSAGIEDPLVPFLGEKLANEYGTDEAIGKVSDVPGRSILSRITDHYLQILANQAPIGFEAEFVNRRGRTILYRGILLPFSSDGETIDFIYGVINWAETAAQSAADELLLEVDQALVPDVEGGASPLEHGGQEEPEPAAQSHSGGNLPRPSFGSLAPIGEDEEGYYDSDEGEEDEDEDGEGEAHYASLLSSISSREIDLPRHDSEAGDLEDTAEPAREGDGAEQPVSARAAKKAIDLSAYSPDSVAGDQPAREAANDFSSETGDFSSESGLHAMLAKARELAFAACSSEDRSRAALYEAVGRAYDVSIAAGESPGEFAELVTENGLTVQDRAPMTPIVKLVFGADYDKTRITEYAAVLGHAHRIGVERGALSVFLSEAEGGLKGVVQAERRLRREESGKIVQPAEAVRESLARKLRELEARPLDTIDGEGAEFALVMIRRLETGEVVVVGEISDDIPMIEKAGRKLVS